MPRPTSPPLSLLGVPLAVRPGGHVQIGSSPRTGSVVGPLSTTDLEAVVAWGRAPDAVDATVAGPASPVTAR